MKLNKMKWIDQWVGMPICFLFGFFCSLLRIFGKRSIKHENITYIAVFKFFGIGSIIQATPMLRALKKRYPNAVVHFVTFKGNEGGLKELGIVDKITTIRTTSALRFGFDTIRTIISLAGRGTDVTIDLEFFSKFSTMTTFLTGAPMRIGFHLNDFWRRSLIKHPIYFNYFRHISQVYSDVGRHMDFKVEDLTLPELSIEPAKKDNMLTHLQQLGHNKNNTLIGINVNANDLCLERRWPLDRWALLIEQLLEKNPNTTFLLTGNNGEKEYVQQLFHHLPEHTHKNIILGAGLWSLTDFFTALSVLDLFITNDTGPMHLAAITRTRTLSLWGPVRPDCYEPQSPTHSHIYSNYHCSPCVNMFTSFSGMWCEHEGNCMLQISVDQVFNKTIEILSEPS